MNLSSELYYHKYLSDKPVSANETYTQYTTDFQKLTCACVTHIPLTTPHQMHSCELSNAARGSQSTAVTREVLVNVWAHRLGLVTALQSWHQIGCHLYLLSRVCLCTVETTVATHNCRVERQVLNTWCRAIRGHDEKHWLINTRENTVWNCPSAAMPLQFNSLGYAEVELITILACVWLIG